MMDRRRMMEGKTTRRSEWRRGDKRKGFFARTAAMFIIKREVLGER